MFFNAKIIIIVVNLTLFPESQFLFTVLLFIPFFCCLFNGLALPGENVSTWMPTFAGEV